MSLWKRSNNANSAPKITVLSNSGTKGNDAFGNTTVGAFIPSEADGVYLEDNQWVLKRYQTGGVSALTIVLGGTGYTNSTNIRVSGGTTNSTANVRCNANGVITSIINLTSGAGFTNNSVVTLTILNAGSGNSANIAVTLGGRAGVVKREVVVS